MRVVAQVGDAGHLAQEDIADLGAVLVDRRDQNVTGPVVAELDDQLGQVGLDGGDAFGVEVFVEADLLGGHRLDLDDFAGAGGPDQPGDDSVCFIGVAGPMHHAAASGDVAFQFFQQFG